MRPQNRRPRHDSYGTSAWKRCTSRLIWSDGQTTPVHPHLPLYLQELDVPRLLANPVVYPETTRRKREINEEFGEPYKGKEGATCLDTIAFANNFFNFCSLTLLNMRL